MDQSRLPKDGGTKLMQYLLTNNKPLLGAGDISLKNDNISHAWILATGEVGLINDPLMNLSGGGPVDDYQADMSSARGETHGQTALAIMSHNLLKAHNQENKSVIIYWDNIGVQGKCKGANLHLCDH